MEENKNNDIVIYQTEDGITQIEVRLENENVWLTQQQMADLYQTSRTNVVEHIKHIYEEQELDEISTCRNFRQVRTEGNRQVEREIPFYNLDMIISLGYRVKSRIATNFRRWATGRRAVEADGRRRVLARTACPHPRHPFVGEGDVSAGAGFVCYKCRL